MSHNTKIVVLRSKQLVYALVLIAISALIIIAAAAIFSPKKEKTDTTPASEPESETQTETETDKSGEAIYTPGIYTSAVQLGSSNAELQVTVDADRITSIRLECLDESIATLYPLMEPTLEELSASIIESQSLDSISYDDDNRYTSMLLMQAISTALEKASIASDAVQTDDNIENTIL